MKRIKEQRDLKDLLEVGYLYVCLFLYLDITDEFQGERFLAIQDAKQAVEQFELRTHSRFSVYKKDKGFGEKG